MKCAVDGNADDACTVPAFTVTDKPLVAEAANVVCTSAPTPAPTQKFRQANPFQCKFNSQWGGEWGHTGVSYHTAGMTANQCGDRILSESGCNHHMFLFWGSGCMCFGSKTATVGTCTHYEHTGAHTYEVQN